MTRRTWGTIAAALMVALSFMGTAYGQGAIQQAGPATPGHSVVFLQNGIAMDGGSAAGGPIGTGISELGLIVRSLNGGTPPFANAGTGPLATNSCDYDAPTNNPTGYHFLCLSPNAQGGGLLAYGAGGTATPLPFVININGTIFNFPGTGTGDVSGPNSSVVGDLSCWANTAGTLLNDCGGPGATPIRRVTSGSSDTASVSDHTIAWSSSSGSSRAQAVYACTSGTAGRTLAIKDESGTSFPIVVTPASGTIENGSSYTLYFSLEALDIQCDGAGNWIVL